jgi:hypothetical protein
MKKRRNEMKTKEHRGGWVIAAVATIVAGSACMSVSTESGGTMLAGDTPPAYFVFRQVGSGPGASSLLFEANSSRDGAIGVEVTPTCSSMGGCRVGDPDIDLTALQFSPAEVDALRREMREGRVVVHGQASRLTAVAASGPGTPATLRVDQLWRAPRALVASAFSQFYLVSLPTAFEGFGSVWGSYLASPLNTSDAERHYDTLQGVPSRTQGDVFNRGGLIVQGGTAANPTTGAPDPGVLRVDNYFRRWEPRAEFECDVACGGLASCLSCGTASWVCADACPSVACDPAACGDDPGPIHVCHDGSPAAHRCAPLQDDGTCAWQTDPCSFVE